MGSKESQRTCYFRLEQTANGYLTGNLVCSYCGAKIPQSWWVENIDPTRSNFSSSTTSPKSASSDSVKPGSSSLPSSLGGRCPGWHGFYETLEFIHYLLSTTADGHQEGPTADVCEVGGRYAGLPSVCP